MLKKKKQTPSQIAIEILEANKKITYDLTKILANRSGCKEDTIRRGLEPDRVKGVVKEYSEKGVRAIIAWRLKTKKVTHVKRNNNK